MIEKVDNIRLYYWMKMPHMHIVYLDKSTHSYLHNYSHNPHRFHFPVSYALHFVNALSPIIAVWVCVVCVGIGSFAGLWLAS